MIHQYFEKISNSVNLSNPYVPTVSAFFSGYSLKEEKAKVQEKMVYFSPIHKLFNKRINKEDT
jgi:hypothetical protein